MLNVEIVLISLLCGIHLIFVISVLIVRLPKKEMEIHQTKAALIALCLEVFVAVGMMTIAFLLSEDVNSRVQTQIESVCISAVLLVFSFLLFSDWAYIKDGELVRHIAFFYKRIPLNNKTTIGLPTRFVRIAYENKRVILSGSYSDGSFPMFYQKMNNECGLY